MRTYEEDLKDAVAFHGHLCGGQILGVRMARIALKYFGIEDPIKYKDLVVYIEADRCLADAITVVTKCTMGRRRLKWMDYGKMAATFVDISKNKAIRVGPKSTSVNPQKGEDINEFWNKVPDEDVFNVQEVIMDIPAGDLPGKPLQTVKCEQCDEKIHDGRQVVKEGKTLCRPCANGAYYKLPSDGAKPKGEA